MDNIKYQKSNTCLPAGKVKNTSQKSKIYIFGNPLIKEDSLPLKLLPELKKKFSGIEFIVTDPNENFPPKGETDLIILDTVLGIKEPMVLDLDNLKKLKTTPVSPHDYDLLFHLLLLKKTKRLNKVIIIGVPEHLRGAQSNRSLKFILDMIHYFERL